MRVFCFRCGILGHHTVDCFILAGNGAKRKVATIIEKVGSHDISVVLDMSPESMEGNGWLLVITRRSLLKDMLVISTDCEWRRWEGQGDGKILCMLVWIREFRIMKNLWPIDQDYPIFARPLMSCHMDPYLTCSQMIKVWLMIYHIKGFSEAIMPNPSHTIASKVLDTRILWCQRFHCKVTVHFNLDTNPENHGTIKEAIDCMGIVESSVRDLIK